MFKVGDIVRLKSDITVDQLTAIGISVFYYNQLMESSLEIIEVSELSYYIKYFSIPYHHYNYFYINRSYVTNDSIIKLKNFLTSIA